MTGQTTTRHAVVVDVETSGLIPDHDVAVEVAWLDMTTGARGCFVPVHDVAWVLEHGDPNALEINGYRERLQHAPQDEDFRSLHVLLDHLRGNTLAGSNPTFDASFLHPLFKAQPWGHELWHHRLGDLAAYAAGVLGMPLSELPGLASVCDKLGVLNTAPHTAEGDVMATAECFRRLQEMSAR